MDFSSAKFSLNRQVPNYLPARLRLPDKSTRYSYNVTLEEIHLCGYVGPIADPVVTEFEKAEWDPDSCSYVIKPKEESDIGEHTVDVNTRSVLLELLTTFDEFKDNSKSYTDRYFRAMFDYYEGIQNLLKSSKRLTNSDIPQEPSPPMFYMYQSEEDKAYNTWYETSRDSLKSDYETYGVVFGVLDQFRHRFKVESTWVLGSTPLPPDSVSPVFDYRPTV
jgi:hypothetical protein